LAHRVRRRRRRLVGDRRLRGEGALEDPTLFGVLELDRQRDHGPASRRQDLVEGDDLNAQRSRTRLIGQTHARRRAECARQCALDVARWQLAPASLLVKAVFDRRSPPYDALAKEGRSPHWTQTQWNAHCVGRSRQGAVQRGGRGAEQARLGCEAQGKRHEQTPGETILGRKRTA
jgi:hypothetical protein